jgi:hypothetical protein
VAVLYHRETLLGDDAGLAGLPLALGVVRPTLARLLKALNEREYVESAIRSMRTDMAHRDAVVLGVGWGGGLHSCRRSFVEATVWEAQLGFTPEMLTSALLQRLLPRTDDANAEVVMAVDSTAGRSGTVRARAVPSSAVPVCS